MEDENFGYDDDFDLDAEDFFGNEDGLDVAASQGGAEELTGGAGGFHALPSSSSNKLNVYGEGAGTAEQGGATGEGAESEEQVPPVIENVQTYLPNVAPNAFPVIVAVLAQAHLNVGVDLCALSCATRNVEYMPHKRIASATMRLQEPSAVVLVRNTGSLNIIGAASISEARQAAELAARIIRKALNLDFETMQFRVRSIMARFNVCSPVRLDDLARHRLSEGGGAGLGGVFCSYEPERFSGCTVRLVGRSKQNRWNVSCTVFVTGKVSLLGARSEDELRFAFDALVPILSRYLGPVAA